MQNWATNVQPNTICLLPIVEPPKYVQTLQKVFINQVNYAKKTLILRHQHTPNLEFYSSSSKSKYKRVRLVNYPLNIC